MSSAPVLYQETRLSPTPAPASVLHIDAAGSSNTSTTAGRKRPFDEISGLDEEKYARKYLATEGSIYFRPKEKAPRSFLWRVLNDRQLLEVQCVDLVLDKKHVKDESWLTFHIALPSPIIPGGVALADAQEKDGLDIFVLTANNNLYTITLKRELLVRDTVPVDFDSAACVKKSSPGQLSFKRPYRLVAQSGAELFISMHDGSMVRLERQPPDHRDQWRETNFGERGLVRSFRGLIPGSRPQTVRYGESELFGDAIAAIAKSPDDKYIWTVGLDHILKAWSVETGKAVVTRDLLGEGGEDEDRKKHVRSIMNPEQGTKLQVLRPRIGAGKRALQKEDDASNYFLATYSPKNHEFKFYGVAPMFSSIEGESIDLQDVQPNAKLVPPVEDLLNTNIWHLEDFSVYPGIQWQGSQLWIRARSGPNSRTFTLEFDLLDEYGEAQEGLQEDFRTAWTVVDASYGTVDELRRSVHLSGIDPASDSAITPSERWLEYIFYPGRFSEASLETALYIYRKGRNLPSAVSGRGLGAPREPLKERISSAVTAKIPLRRHANEQPDFDQYQQDLHSQWSTFFSLLAHLHGRRHETIGSSFDLESGLAWTICADFVSPIRACSTVELLNLNADLVLRDELDASPEIKHRILASDEDVLRAQILAVARQLRQYFSGPSQDKLRREALSGALEHGTDVSVEDTLQLLDTQCNFRDEIGDEEFSQLEQAADQFNTFGSLTDDHFLMVVESLEESPEDDGKHGGQTLGRYGKSMSVAILQETLQRAESVLFDLLALVVFMHCELEQSELSSDFRPKEVYESIMLHLRRNELRLWLCSHVRQAPVHSNSQILGLVTIYESMFAQDWRAMPIITSVEHRLPEALTLWSKRWAFGLDLGQFGDSITSHTLADFIIHGNTELALDFAKFVSDSPWVSYLKGRLYLATGDYELASIAFRDAADEMASLKQLPSPVVPREEAQELFGQGHAFYYKHVTSLFEKAAVPSYTTDFASMALRYLSQDDYDQSLMEIDHRKSQEGSHHEILGNTMEEIHILKLRATKDSLLSSKFSALNQTGRFELAFDALARIHETERQNSCLQTLFETCIKSDCVAAMLGLEIRGDLAQEADSILLGMAKKSMSSGLPSGPAYHQILFAFRTQQSNFRGAAAILYEHLERLRKSNKLAIRDPDNDTLPQMYVLLINTLACCGEDQGWLLADPIEGVHVAGSKRKLVTLEDIRRDYTAELDRRSEITQGRFPLIGGDEMDVF